MSDIDNILLEEHPAEGVVLVRLHRPDVLNALNLALRRALAEVFTRLDGDPTVKARLKSEARRAFGA